MKLLVPSANALLKLHLFLLLAISIYADPPQRARWIGTADGVWSDPANWDIGRVPTGPDVPYNVFFESPVTLRVDIPVTVYSAGIEGAGVLDVAASLEGLPGGLGFFFNKGMVTGTGVLNLGYYQFDSAAGVTMVFDGISPIGRNFSFYHGALELRNRPAEGRFSHLSIPAGGRFWMSEFGAPFFLDVTPAQTRSHVENAGEIQINRNLISRADFLNHNLMTIENSTLTLTNADVVQDGGVLTIQNGSIVNHSTDPARGKVMLQSGSLVGGGQIDIAEIGAAGHSPAVLSGQFAFKDLTLAAGGTLSTMISGTGIGAVDHFVISRKFSNHGHLAVDLTPEFAGHIQRLDVFRIVDMQAGAAAEGAFDNVAFGQRIHVGNWGTMIVAHPADSPNSIQLTDFVAAGFTIEDAADFSMYPLFSRPYFIAKADQVVQTAAINWEAGSLTVRIENGDSNDHIAIRGIPANAQPIAAARDASDPAKFRISYAGAPFATATGFDPGRDDASTQIEVKFEAGATPEAIQALIQSLVYTNDIYGFGIFTNDLSRTFPPREISVRLREPSGFYADDNKTVDFPAVLRIGPIPDVIEISPAISKQLTVQAIFNNPERTELANVGNQGQFDGSECRLPIAFSPVTNRPSTVVVSYVGNTATDEDCAIIIRAGPFATTACLRVLSLSPGIARCILDEIDALPPDCTIDLERGLMRQTALAAQPTAHYGLIALASFKALESLMNQTEEGRRLTGLYWKHTREWFFLCVADPTLLNQTRDVVTRFQPAVNSYLAGKGTNVINNTMITALNLLWNAVTNRCSPGMRADMAAERARFNNFQDFVGRTFNEWGQMLNIPVPSGPIVTLSNVRASAGQFTAEANYLSGVTYSLGRSEDLINWTVLPASTLRTNGFFVYVTDTATPARQQFYKLFLKKP